METKKSLKKFFFMLGTWLVVIVAVIGGSILHDQFKTSEYDDRAVPYIKKVIPKISQWDPEQTKALMASEVAESISEENFVNVMALFSKLGELQNMKEPKFEEVHTDTKANVGEQTIIEYKIDAKYAKGDATITLKLLESNDSFKVYRFNFSSKTLLE